jgi:hypothetical protein
MKIPAVLIKTLSSDELTVRRRDALLRSIQVKVVSITHPLASLIYGVVNLLFTLISFIRNLIAFFLRLMFCVLCNENHVEKYHIIGAPVYR